MLITSFWCWVEQEDLPQKFRWTSDREGKLGTDALVEMPEISFNSEDLKTIEKRMAQNHGLTLLPLLPTLHRPCAMNRPIEPPKTVSGSF